MSEQHNISKDLARNILLKQALARNTLCGFARYIDIPGVPDDGDISDRLTKIVETPLARHHIVGLQAMQLLVQRCLTYDPQTLDSTVDFGLLRTDWTKGETADPAAKKGRTGSKSVGGGSTSGATPSGNAPKIQTPLNKYLGPQATDLQGFDLLDKSPSAENHGVIPPENPVLPKFSASGISPEAKAAQRVILETLLLGQMSELEARTGLHTAWPLGEVCHRLMVLEPPGSAKSTYGSVVTPAWVLGREKMFEMILTGWGDPICRRHGKRARQICSSEPYRVIFGTGLDPNTRAAEDWALQNASTYKSSGILSGVTGFRCMGLVWDDLTKNRKEADSPTIRDDTHNEYIDSARSRKTPNAWEIGIGTRWHENEIMGRILPEGYSGQSGFMRCRDGNVWFVICMAAQCEREDDPLGREIGEMIWPEWFGERYWADKKMNARSWGSLYQQRPAPDEGICFKREDDRRHDGNVEGDYYISFDPAVSTEEDADETAIHVWCVDSAGLINEVEEWVGRETMDVWIHILINLIRRYRPLEVISESGVIRRAAEPFIKRAMVKTKVFASFTWVTRHADKLAMARPAQAMHASHQIRLLPGPVGDRFMDELVAFPARKEDHRVDSLANLCLRLEAIWDANPPKPEEEKSVNIGSFGGAPIPIKQFMPERFEKRSSRWKRTH